jgi:hypothetical protein
MKAEDLRSDIVRLDSGKGWRVQTTRQGNFIYRYFFDVTFGDSAQASRLAARSYREEQLKRAN